MENIFDLEPQEPQDPVKMNQGDFMSKTKGLLAKIDSIYSKGWQNRHLLDSEYPDESICDKCTGCGVFKHDGEEKECRQNGEEGYCYHRFCDYEQVGMELEEQVESIYEILSVDILTT